jgi:hypothetical protein
MGIEGFVLCALMTGADYGSTRIALSRPGVQEVGPVARHSLVAGASVKSGACIAGEVLGRKQSKRAKWVRRGLGVALTGVIVAHNLRQRGRP